MLFSAGKLVLRGWSPADGNEEELYVTDVTCFTTPSATLERSCHLPLHSESASAVTSSKSSSLTHSQLAQSATSSSPILLTHRFPIAPSSDRRAQRNRTRDPGWIPRPRNAFIIFRCDYSREHAAQTSQESDEQSLSKTLSKRAAEAWKQLSAEEKDKYRHLADREREEHTRIYPHYRFRPMRRQASGSKKPYFAPAGIRFENATETPSHSLSLTKSADISLNEGGATPLSSIPEEMDKSPEITRRRASSVPHRNLLSGSPLVPSDYRDRRSFSLIDGIVIAREPSDCVAQITHPLTFDDAGPIAAAGIYPASVQSDAYCASPQDQHGVWHPGKPEYPINSTHPSSDLPLQIGLPFGDDEETSCLAAPFANGSSSLCGWNGNFGPSSPPVSVSGSGYAASTSSQESPSSPPPGSANNSSIVSNESQEPGVLAQGLHQPPCNGPSQVTTDIVPNFGGGGGSSFDAFTKCVGDPVSPSYDEMERAQALEAYAIGLQNCNLFSSAPSMYSEFSATPTLDPPQPSFEEELARFFPEQASQSMLIETGVGKSGAAWQDGVS